MMLKSLLCDSHKILAQTNNRSFSSLEILMIILLIKKLTLLAPKHSEQRYPYKGYNVQCQVKACLREKNKAENENSENE